MLEGVKHVIVILSGKGGVGKSTISCQLALCLKAQGFKVGILDVDLCGPSIPYLLGLEGQSIHQCSQGWVPVYPNEDQNLAVMSIGFLLQSRDDPVVWRGPKKNAMIKQFLADVFWGDLDYLLIDTPPGTSDEHITVMENIRQVHCDGAILVTTPQAVAVGDVRREATFCKKAGIPILGVIENMSGFTCPHCKECTNIFSMDGGKQLAKIAQVPFLGSVPINPEISGKEGGSIGFVDAFQSSSLFPIIHSISCKLTQSAPSKSDTV
ncbi:unnamed protein product [Darwinula stevensoni]|uniref:Cytosolic Fe-S cluster assembly factor NUBP2 homolog n=1 Tax=Darwinula stevensoni TaxID=69355 RepID=A0A7R8X329_9CRUS|nr:unnamed protein product [Darwinula stevensoni]CAG0881907.1 unnamed protein product [Darwinula stevensoni]